MSTFPLDPRRFARLFHPAMVKAVQVQSLALAVSEHRAGCWPRTRQEARTDAELEVMTAERDLIVDQSRMLFDFPLPYSLSRLCQARALCSAHRQNPLRTAEPHYALQKGFASLVSVDMLRLIACRSMKAWSCSSVKSSSRPPQDVCSELWRVRP